MFKTDDLIYIQLQKTGCTHIATLLGRLFDGQQVGKHNAATQAQIDSDTFFLSSIRNPWEWYLSLWTYGVQGGGGLMDRLTHRHYRKALKKTVKRPWKHYSELWHEHQKDISCWHQVYQDSEDVMGFRQWLKLMHEPRNARCLGEGYDQSGLAALCGFMTYRYLYLCCSQSNSQNISSYNELSKFETQACYIDFFVRQESLEEGLCKALDESIGLTPEQLAIIMSAKKTNTSKRPLTLAEYYDQETIELVLQRDRLLIEKFQYPAPAL